MTRPHLAALGVALVAATACASPPPLTPAEAAHGLRIAAWGPLVCARLDQPGATYPQVLASVQRDWLLSSGEAANAVDASISTVCPWHA